MRSLRPALAVLAALAVLPAPDAHAGYRELELLVTNMTPSPSEAARECSARLRRALRRDDTLLSARGETALRSALAAPDGPFLGWPADAFAELRARTGVDAVILFDCRPEAQRFDALVVATGGRSTLTLRARSLDAPRVRQLAERLRVMGYLGFSP